MASNLKHKAAFQKIILALSTAFKSHDEIMGCYFNFEVLYLELIEVERLSLELNEMVFAVASKLIESGLFEIRIYDNDTKNIWNPLECSYLDFKEENPSLSGFMADNSKPDLQQVLLWVNGYFNA